MAVPQPQSCVSAFLCMSLQYVNCYIRIPFPILPHSKLFSLIPCPLHLIVNPIENHVPIRYRAVPQSGTSPSPNPIPSIGTAILVHARESNCLSQVEAYFNRYLVYIVFSLRSTLSYSTKIMFYEFPILLTFYDRVL